MVAEIPIEPRFLAKTYSLQDDDGNYLEFAQSRQFSTMEEARSYLRMLGRAGTIERARKLKSRTRVWCKWVPVEELNTNGMILRPIELGEEEEDWTNGNYACPPPNSNPSVTRSASVRRVSRAPCAFRAGARCASGRPGNGTSPAPSRSYW